MLHATLPEIRVHSAPATVSFAGTVDAPSDHDLMIAVRAGEIGQLGELFERHHQRLYGFFVRLTHQPSVSEDLVQTVFYRILKYRHTYRDEGKFTAWAYHLARKVAADHYRKHAHAPAATDPAALHDHADLAPDSAARATAADDLAFLRTALARLPLAQREVLVLSRLQSLEHKEIARLLDCSVGAVKVRVHRALQELRTVYFRLRQGKSP